MCGLIAVSKAASVVTVGDTKVKKIIQGLSEWMLEHMDVSAMGQGVKKKRVGKPPHPPPRRIRRPQRPHRHAAGRALGLARLRIEQKAHPCEGDAPFVIVPVGQRLADYCSSKTSRTDLPPYLSLKDSCHWMMPTSRLSVVSQDWK